MPAPTDPHKADSLIASLLDQSANMREQLKLELDRIWLVKE